MDRTVLIGTPTYDGKLHDAMAHAMSIQCRNPAWATVTMNSRRGDADIGRARNALAMEALECGFSDLLFWDSDVVPEDGAMARIMAHKADVVLGCPPHRNDCGGYPIVWCDEPELWAVDPETRVPSADGLIRIEAGPTGFMRITRAALLRMRHYYADLWYWDETVTGGKAWGMFDFTVEDNIRRSEDLSFCRKWRTIGGEIWLDPNITFSHIGHRTWTGNIGEWLRSRAVEPVADITESAAA